MFAFWELAKYCDLQEKLHAEINGTLAEVRVRGDVDFTANDFKRMPRLVATTNISKMSANLFFTRFPPAKPRWVPHCKRWINL